jgi:hypothetical protein
MNVGEHVVCAIDDFEDGKFNAALLHACIAIDGTANKIDSSKSGNRQKYVACLRQYYWLLEPMLGCGINLVETRFNKVPLAKNSAPDIAEIIYEVFRCNHAHGSEHPPNYSFSSCVGTEITVVELADGILKLPDRIVFALLSIAVLSKVNRNQKAPDTYFLSLGQQQFLLKDWWGREDDFRTIADRYNQIRITLKW